MGRYVLKRTGAAIATLVAASVIIFGFIHLIPGDPVAPPNRCKLEGAEMVRLPTTKFPAVHQWLVISPWVTDRLVQVLHEGPPRTAAA